MLDMNVLVLQNKGFVLPTIKIALRLISDGDGRQNMAKCRSSLGVTGLRPPPGGAHAEQIVTF